MKSFGITMQKLTIELAREFADMRPAPGERELLKKRTDYLLKQLHGGRFMAPRWVKASLLGEWYRIDGQHSSKLLADLPVNEFPGGLSVLVESFEIEDPDEFSDLYDRYNHPISGRSNSDKLRFYVARYGPPEISEAIIGRAIKGIEDAIRTSRPNDKRRYLLGPARDRGQMLTHKWVRDFAIFLSTFTEWKHGKFLALPGLVAEIYSDWDSDQDMAFEFWAHVFRDDHPMPDNETRVLADELVKVQRSERAASRTAIRRKASKAWKTYIGKRSRGTDGQAVLSMDDINEEIDTHRTERQRKALDKLTSEAQGLDMGYQAHGADSTV